VSGRCFRIDGDKRDVVVKQVLAQLSVAAVWTAKVERAITEGAALELVHSLTPQSTPQPLDVDHELFAITMTASPRDYRSWKEALLDRDQAIEETVLTAALIGAVVGEWHQRTWGDEATAARFDDYEAFEQLRIAPFHRTILAAHPNLAHSLEQCIDELSISRQCFVHGDLSPKNILIGDGIPWIIDFEVGHFGAAVFDLAFLQCHLMLKAIHQPDRASGYRAAAAAFVAGYRKTCTAAPEFELLGWQTASLLLARVDGKSPVSYLTTAERDTTRELAVANLTAASTDIAALWDAVEGVLV
jgi:5-methylthioribose kinase